MSDLRCDGEVWGIVNRGDWTKIRKHYIELLEVWLSCVCGIVRVPDGVMRDE